MTEVRIQELLALLKNSAGLAETPAELVEEAYQLVENYEDTSEELAFLAYEVANYFSVNGEFAKAMACRKKVLTINNAVFGKEHPYTAAAYSALADLSVARQEYWEACEYFNRAIEIAEKTVGTLAPFTIINYTKLGAAYRLNEQVARALAFFTKAMVSLEEDGQNPLLLGEVYCNIAEIYSDIPAEEQSAKLYYQKAFDTLLPSLGPAHDFIKKLAAHI